MRDRIMDCRFIEREDLIEKYLTGKLSPAHQNEFEAHCFGCPRCLQELQFVRMLQAKLWEKGESALFAERASVSPGRRRGALAWVGAAVALLVVGAVLWRQFGASGNRSAGEGGDRRSLGALARFEPPPYLPLAMRGVVDEAAERFRAGMGHYLDGRYGEAIPELRAAAAIAPQRAGTRFFLGICLLLAGKTDEGIEELGRTVSLGESAYLEEAHFYRAKAFLAKGDAGAARSELAWVFGKGGDLKDEAARLLAQLR
jgi:tetratricopeptide (TPR) repeat protein